MFLFNIIVSGFKIPKLKNTNFWSKRGLQQNGFLSTCALQNVKSYRFFGGGHFMANFVDVQKHYKIGISAHFWKQKNKTNTIFQSY